MISLRLALLNLWRRPGRTGVSIASVAVAVAALFSLLAFQRGYTRGMTGELDRLGAHVLIVPKGCPYDAASIALHGARWPCYLKTAFLEEVKATPSVATTAPVFMSAVYDSDGDQHVYSGVTPEILRLKPGWRIQGSFPDRAGELLAGSDRARKQGWKLGMTVSLPGLDGEKGRVAGILQPTGGADDTFSYLSLSTAQRIFKRPRELTHILVSVHDPEKLDQAVTELRSCGAGGEMNVIPMTHLFRTIQDLVLSTRLLLGAIVLVALLVAGAGVSNTMLMAVVERTGEIGIMRALGASRWDVFRLFWMEAAQVCLLGGVAGILAAFAGSRVIEAWLRSRLPFTPSGVLIQWEWAVALACLGAVLVVGMLAGFLPSWRAVRLAPMEAIRVQGTGT